MNTRSSLRFLVFVGLASVAGAQIQFSIVLNAFLSDSLGTPTADMPYAIVIDTQNNGFVEGTYLAFDLNTNLQLLSSSGGLTDDLYVFPGVSPQLTNDTDPFVGAAGTLDFDNFDGSYTGLPFSVIWFESGSTAGAAYGFSADADFFMPNGGETFSASGTWDPGSANLTLLAAVPEPTALAAILGLGGLFALLRRRR